MFFHWFVVITSNIAIYEAAKIVYKNVYSVDIPPGYYRFAMPKRMPPLARDWYEVIYKPFEDSFLHGLDSIASDREPIGWEYYDDTRKQELSRSEIPAYSFSNKVKKVGKSLIDVIPFRCKGLPPAKAERCLASYRQKKLVGHNVLSGFSMGYYDDSSRLGPRGINLRVTEDFDDMEESPCGNIYIPNPASEEEYGSAKTEYTEANKWLRSPGDYGNYDSESDEEKVDENDMESISKVYTEITGDNNVDKHKIIKFVAKLKEKLRLYSSAPKEKQVDEDFTRSSQHLLQKYDIEYISRLSSRTQ